MCGSKDSREQGHYSRALSASTRGGGRVALSKEQGLKGKETRPAPNQHTKQQWMTAHSKLPNKPGEPKYMPGGRRRRRRRGRRLEVLLLITLTELSPVTSC